MSTTEPTIDPVEVLDGVEMYRIDDIDAMAPFLMTVVSSSDLWMFLSSTGGLTAGRTEPADALFPYETDDRLHHVAGRVGPVTVLTAGTSGGDGTGTVVWEPFAPDAPDTTRSLLKSLRGDAVVMEARHATLDLVVRARWAPSDRFGWVRTVSLHHEGDVPLTVDVVDGLLDVMPWGVGVALQQQRSNLANAYRRSEVLGEGLGVYSLEAQVIDRPDPAEALRATTVWTTGLGDATVTVDPAAVTAARDGRGAAPVTLRTGRPGSYVVQATVDLAAGETRRWHMVADVAQGQADVARLTGMLRDHRADGDRVDDADGAALAATLEDDLRASSDQLARIVATADGVHRTGSRTSDAHDRSNTMFNVMRGGTFLDGTTVHGPAFVAFVVARNREVATRHASWLEALPDTIDVQALTARAADVGDPDLVRLARSYLPLTFSRRHGDPSRPWNHFSIRVRDADGQPVLGYQGNWRDIFQNWEALCRSHPAYLPSVVATFLNASTADGHNPYRITDEGIDWEVLDPDDPWSGIGYWGDHQIVYLHRLLRATEAHLPGWLARTLPERTHAYADVPYRIADLDALLADPKDTVAFDDDAAEAVQDRVDRRGGDGRLVVDDDGAVVHVSLLEKLLVPALAKLGNLVPRGGIWMNTQRPEWNDANNALVGWGLSMVTLAHLRPYLLLLADLAPHLRDLAEPVPVSGAVLDLLDALTTALEAEEDALAEPTLDGAARRRVVDGVGGAVAAYRDTVYAGGLGASRALAPESLARLCRVALRYVDDALDTARRDDGLFHSYNLLRIGDDGTAEVEHLEPMLEGQVAAISADHLSAGEVVALVEAMYDSPLYRPDVDSFMLYPATPRPTFMDRNRVPAAAVADNPLLTTLLAEGHGDVIVVDVEGQHRFGADLRNAADLERALSQLPDHLDELVAAHRAATLQLFEDVFDHHAFTGRSSTMYAYEGLGSVYWHMVAKLLVAVQERVLADDAPPSDRAALLSVYRRVRDGLGFNRTAPEYGAFPTDAYSHTPAHAGAQQPGMTGQVKEELLTRWAELGLTVVEGQLVFTDVLVDPDEALTAPVTLTHLDVNSRWQQVDVPAGCVALTLCQVPVVVHIDGDEARITVTTVDGPSRSVPGRTLDLAASQAVLGRDGTVARLEVWLGSG